MALREADLVVGDVHREVVVENLTRTQIVMYAGASGDFHPVHTDQVFAQASAGERGVFAHGMLTMAMTGKMLTNYVGDGRLTRYSARFRSQVWPGDTLTASARVAAIRSEGAQRLVDLEVSTVNQQGEEVLSGSATARIDA